MAQTNRGKTPPSAKSNSKTSARPNQSAAKKPHRREIMAAICFLLSIFTFIGYWNSDGAFIGLFCGMAKGLVGHGFYALPPALLVCSAILTFHRGRPVRFRVICTLMLTAVIGALAHLSMTGLEYDRSLSMVAELWKGGAELQSGGAIGGALSELFSWLFSRTGAAIVFILSAAFLMMSAFNKTVAGIFDAIKTRERREYIPEPEPEPETVTVERPSNRQRRPAATRKNQEKADIDIPLDGEPRPPVPDYAPKPLKEQLPVGSPRVKTPDQLVTEHVADEDEAQPDEPEKIEDTPLDIPFMESKRGGDAPQAQAAPEPEAPTPEPPAPPKTKKQPEPIEQIEPLKADPDATYDFPPIELLSAGVPRPHARDEDEVRVNSERLESAFRSFGVNVSIANTTRGPAVTRYEAELEAGVKLSRLTGLADDIALSLGASGVRIAAMPNKISTVGIEVPNKVISTVNLRDIIESQEFKHAKSKLTFAVGMDISGDAVVGSISKLPHMLVAGTTGSGKSVCMNSLILSILYKATPEDVRFIMIDPKMVEFKVYNSIPHLLVPVVTDVKKAAGALQWAVVEMMKRYALFSETNARDIEGYNQIAAKSDDRDTLPQVIVVIDELADLMMMAAKEVEESVCRVAQMGRAAGMHLIIATQSPRADVITGLMKANIPSRIALKVSSALESRIILDAGGNADKLVGNGDMLYAPIGTTKPMRVQGTWVSDEEREKVVKFINKSGESQYSEEVMGEIERAAVEKPTGEKQKDSSGESDYDELLPQAVDVIFETGQASVSMLQRRLKLGYSRAARIVDQMEKMEIVGPFEGSKPRAVLVTKEQWRQMQYISGNAPQDKPFPAPVISASHHSSEDGMEIEDSYGNDDSRESEDSYDGEDGRESEDSYDDEDSRESEDSYDDKDSRESNDSYDDENSRESEDSYDDEDSRESNDSYDDEDGRRTEADYNSNDEAPY